MRANLSEMPGRMWTRTKAKAGHVSVQTAERYLGCKKRIRSAVNDRIGIEPSLDAAVIAQGLPRNKDAQFGLADEDPNVNDKSGCAPGASLLAKGHINQNLGFSRT
jgi:hypothetical protein